MTTRQTNHARELLSSRRALLRGAAIGGAGLALGRLAALPALAASSAPDIPQLTNVALTAEMLSVTFYSYAIANAQALGISGEDLIFLKATHTAEQDHVFIFQRLGGQPLTDTFSLPAGAATFASRAAFNQTILGLESASVGAYITGTPVFAQAGRPDLAQLGARLAATEGEHRVLARRLAGLFPANDRSLEDTPFASIADLLRKASGFFHPTPGNSFQYPGPVSVDSTGVTNRYP